MSAALWIALAASAAVCYFAALNMALKRYSRSRLGDLLDQRNQSSRMTALQEHTTAYVLMTGVFRAALNLLVLLAVLYDMEHRLGDASLSLRYVTAFLIAAALVSVFAVAIPTSWSNYLAEPLLARSLPLLAVMFAALRPFVAVLHLFDPVIRRISGVDLAQHEESELSDEVLTVVEDRDMAGDVDETQKQMLEAVFDLPGTDVAEVMTPRTDVQGIDVNSTLEQVKQEVQAFGHSRIPVYEESLDHVVGILYVKDLIPFVGGQEQFDLRRVLREPFFVPASKKVHELLAEFKTRKVHVAVVLDEYGGTAGLVSIEDVLEEIVGDIQDEYEHSETEPGLERIDDYSFEVDGRLRIDQLNDELDLHLPENDDYDTIGGFVVSTLGRIPDSGEHFEADGCMFIVTAAERTKVTRVRVEKIVATSEE
ncbi:MAG: HlyC/CorC family transporter [Phycisphaeraceae bacterium]|nr:HlyC/CorC family transporter [Phycisphaeraceae bacterium]